MAVKFNLVKSQIGADMASNSSNPSTGYFGLTGDELVDATTNGYKWILESNRTIDISVANGLSGEYWYNIASVAEYLENAATIFSYYADVNFHLSGTFTNAKVAYSQGSDITLSLDGANQFFSSSSTWAIGLFPDSKYNSIYNGAPGDMYLNINSAANYLSSYEPGSQGWFLLIHEIGHTLGLKHPHDDGGTGRPTYNSLGLGSLDIDWATIMSYNDNGSWNQFSWDPATPMILDVYALQYLYGKNNDVNNGDSIFTLSSDGFYKTLWDPSGADTVDASSNLSGWTIFLPNESLSTLVDTRAGFAAPTAELSASIPRTLIWLAGDYENARGSNYADSITGNLFANVINGGSGNDDISGGDGDDFIYGEGGDDSIFGDQGNDKIDGGLGYDYALYGANKSSIVAASKNALGVTTIRTGFGTDTLTNVESVAFADGVLVIDDLIARYAPPSYKTNNGNVKASIYAGPVDFLQFELLGSSIGDIATGSISNDFINLLGGDDAANGDTGQDVLDGGVGSNFLSGGSGPDTFFLDGRNGTSTWSTITDFSAEDNVNIWGWQKDASKLILSLDNQGAEGFKGATFHYDLNGNGTIDTSITFSNLALASIPIPTAEEVAGNGYLLFA